MLRYLLIPIVLLALAFGLVYAIAGRAAAPAIQIHQPGKLVGQDATLDLTVEAPRGAFRSIEITLAQKGRTFPLFSLKSPGEATPPCAKFGALSAKITRRWALHPVRSLPASGLPSD